MWPQPPLLPATARDRARVRALAQLIACDVHPLNNLRVMQYLERDWGVPQPEREVWSRHWMAEGFAAFEALLQHHPSTGVFCDGVAPGIADCFLIPRVYNARRCGVELTPYPTIVDTAQASERTIVWQGTSAAVRVDLGGRRLIKTDNENDN